MYMYLVATVRAAYSTCPGSMHLTHLPLLPPTPSQVVYRNVFRSVRVNGCIVLLVKHSKSTIDMTTQGSTKRSLTRNLVWRSQTLYQTLRGGRVWWIAHTIFVSFPPESGGNTLAVLLMEHLWLRKWSQTSRVTV